MTLLELLVVLILLGLAAALVAPVLRLPAAGTGGAEESAPVALGRAADAARALALRRGEAVVLAVAADGRWTVTPAVAAADTVPLLGGRAAVAVGAPLRVVVSPVGTCVPDATGADGAPVAVWDAARCRPVLAAPAAQ
jgi:type II secretory pathway pseudopilin PulG